MQSIILLRYVYKMPAGCVCGARVIQCIYPIVNSVCIVFICIVTTNSALPLGPLLQVVLTISQMMWCRDMDNCLEGDHDHFQALQEFEHTNFEVNFIS